MTNRFEALVSEYFDGRLSPQDAVELAAIIRQDSGKKRLFLELVQQNRLLEVDFGADSEPELVRKILAEIDGGDTGQFVNTVMKGLDAPKSPAVRNRPKGALPARRLPWKLRAGLAAAAVLGGLLGYVLYPSTPEILPVTARVDAVVGDVTLVGGRRIHVGDEIGAGQTLETVGPASSATLSYPDRTRIDLGGDASVRFQADVRGPRGKSLRMNRGFLRADVAKQVPGLPFLIRSTFAEARVLGTKFDLWADAESTRLEVSQGKVRLIRDGDSKPEGVDVGPGEKAVASSQDLVRWTPVCDIDFSRMNELPAQMEALFCSSRVLHTPERKIESGAERIRFESGGLVFDPVPSSKQDHGLVVARWKDDVGDDLVIEAGVAGGSIWSLGFALSGDSFEGYRIIFGIRENPGGIMIDTIAPIEFKPLVSDPRPISFDKDHVLRAEKRGNRVKVWLDRELRIDAVIEHPLAPNRKRTFALSNFGESPVVRSLRVWKGSSEK
ncbi:MAG TPA: FecR family protein [Planctomycetota bacterium]|nr:FecR family protein [Planctomycetota bacterium]